MDSNSGSLQSSSGDEEYDSRAADSSSLSAFMNSSSTHVGSMPNFARPLPPPHLHHHTTQNTSSMFDQSLSGYSFDPLSRSLPNQNPLLNLDMLIWSKPLRSDPNCTDPPNILPSSSPIQTRTAAFRNSSPAMMQIPPMPENAVRPTAASSGQTSTTTGSGSAAAVVRNSKKRSRASRRAPTTVLTTDATNFRAMVQEFTGIPAPPFTTSSSPFPRTRLDLFSSSFSMKPTHLLDPSSTTAPPPPYQLLRPFAQKFQPQPLPFVSSASNNTSAISTNMTSNSTSINYQLPVVNSDLGQVNMHNINPMLSFQSLLQTSKYPLPNSASILGSRSPSDEFGMGHGHVNPHLAPLSNIEGTALRRSNISSNNIANWSGDESNHSEVGADQGLMLRSLNGNYCNPQQQQQQQEEITNGKGNYLASSSSNFHGDRGGSENVSSRSEGMVESWICSSD